MDNGGSLSRLWHDARIFTFIPRRSSRRATFSSLVLVSADRIRDRFIQKNPKIGKLYHSQNLWVTLTLLVLVVYGGRLWLHFPHEAPMDFDPESIFPQLLRRIGQVIH